MTIQIDDLDRQIIAQLQADGRATNKSIATALEVAETTIANRLRRLFEGRIVRISVVEDVRSHGLLLHAIVTVRTAPEKLEAVATALAKVDAITTVTTLMGAPEVVAWFFARDHADIDAVVDQSIAAIPGVLNVEIQVASEVYKYSSSAAMLTDE